MSENLRFPAQAVQGIEHEKWKAMVDSVIDFISASRAMLHLLNDKLADNEKWNEDQRKKIEEEKNMTAFYKDYLSLEIAPKLDRMSATTGTAIENTDVEKFKRGIEIKSAIGTIQKNEVKPCKSCKSCRKLEELPLPEHRDKNPITTSFRNKLFSTQETQLIVENRSEESQYVAENKSINIQTCSKMESIPTDIKCKTQCSKHANNNVTSSPKESMLQKSANALPKNTPKFSKIPKTQSFNDSRNKNSSVGHTGKERPMTAKSICKKRLFQKEATYEDLSQKSKSQML
ncbi:unnamed protein product [Ceutorhynchus assimilis]|uniref:Uncharacterized protein n=1 Tax=Ceutorhynchus assimilis TaxID=467358 RepID=A0A9N9QEM1_9CUCU|nr:unnamed protein product [Ceutorhynchus assimilis]